MQEQIEHSIFILKALIGIISTLSFFLLSLIVYIVKSFKSSHDLLWSKYHILSDHLNKLQGEHEAICRGNHDKKK